MMEFVTEITPLANDEPLLHFLLVVWSDNGDGSALLESSKVNLLNDDPK